MTKKHAGKDEASGAWTCSCGKDSTNTEGTLRDHHTKAATAAGKRLDHRAHASTVIVSSSTLRRGDSVAIDLLTEQDGWIYSGRLRQYAHHGYDAWGCLVAVLDWQTIVADLDSGRLTGPDWEVYLLRAAASLAGYGAVSLVGIFTSPKLPDRALRALHTALTKYV